MVATETNPLEQIPMPQSQLSQAKTLAQRMAEGRLPVAEALRCAMQLGDALRRSHDAGQHHGAVTPANISYSAAGVELQPAPEGSIGATTPYTAPEVLQDRNSDGRSDIFSYGAVLFEMLTGRRAFEGEGRTTLTANINSAPTPSSGSPAADRLIGPCLAKNPDARTPRMQKILMELKLLSVAARRAEAASAPATRREPGVDATVVASMVRAEMQQLESRLTAKLAVHERTVNEIQRSATDAVSALKNQLLSLSGELTAAQERAAQTLAAGSGMDSETSELILTRVDGGFEAVSEHIARIEKSVEEIRAHNSQFERSVAADLVDIEQNIKVHSAAIESARTAMSQTDDLVERVVEALESLQTAVLDQGELPERPTFAVN